MDQKTTFILNLGKYGGYIAVLWVAVSNTDFVITGPLIPFVFLFALDNIRTYYIDNKMPSLGVPSLYLQMLLAYAFLFLDGSTVGGILLIILIAESQLTYPRPTGDIIFVLALIGFTLVSAAGLIWRSALDWENMAAVLINALFFIFAYAVSYMARRQLEERKRAEHALEQLDRSRSDLEKAYHKLVEISKEREHLAAVEERSRLARELHDTLAHTLTTIVVSLEAGKKLLDKNPHKALEEIEKSQEQARRGLDEVRLTVKALRPGDLERMDFAAAIKGIERDYSGSDCKIEFILDEELKLPASVETLLYRIIQESITNSIRHGNAKMMRVSLLCEGNGLILEIDDDGCGTNEIIEGYGLMGIRERATAMGARVSFSSHENGGFLVKLILGEIS